MGEDGACTASGVHHGGVLQLHVQGGIDVDIHRVAAHQEGFERKDGAQKRVIEILTDKAVGALRPAQADHRREGLDQAEGIEERLIGAVLKFWREERTDVFQVFVAGGDFIGIPALDFFDQKLGVEFEIEGAHGVIEDAVGGGDGQPLQGFGQGLAGGLEDALYSFGRGDGRGAGVNGIITDAHAGGQPADGSAPFEDLYGMAGSGQAAACG